MITSGQVGQGEDSSVGHTGQVIGDSVVGHVISGGHVGQSGRVGQTGHVGVGSVSGVGVVGSVSGYRM